MNYIAKFNPYIMEDSVVMAVATGRKQMLHHILGSLEKHIHSSHNTEHLLVYGPRGMGKSFFLKYLQIHFRKNPVFQQAQFLLLPEEQSNITYPSDLIRTILHYAQQQDQLSPVMSYWEEPEHLWRQSYQELKQYIQAQKQKNPNYLLVVVLENVDEILSKFKDKVAEGRFRHLLEHTPHFVLVAASSRDDVDTNYNKRVFHAFKKCRLKPWKEDDYFNYFERRQQLLEEETGIITPPEQKRLQRAKLKAISQFTGGSPRMAVVLTNLLLEEDVVSTAQTLYGLIDDLTPYYQDLTKTIPPKSKILFDTLIRSGENLSQSELAKQLGTSQNSISRAFLWLRHNGYVIGKKRSDSSHFHYYVADRIYVLYYHQREVFHLQNYTPIWLLADFLLSFYQDADELKIQALKHLKQQPSRNAMDLARLSLMKRGFAEEELPVFEKAEEWKVFLEREFSFPDLKGSDNFWSEELRNLEVEHLDVELEAIRLTRDKKYREGIECYELAFLIRQEQENINGQAWNLGQLGWNYEELNEFEKAIRYYQEALKLCEFKKNNFAKAWNLGRLGWNHEELKEYEKSINYHKQALKLFKIEKNTSGEARNLGQIGWNYSELNEFKKANNYHKKALILWKIEKNISFQAWNLEQIGWNYAKLNKSKTSIDYHQKAIELRRIERNQSEQVWNLGQIGWHYAKLGEFLEAINYHQQALDLLKTKDKKSIWNIAQIGVNHFLLNQNKQAWHILDDIEEDKEKVFKQYGDAIIFKAKQEGQAAAFAMGLEILQGVKERASTLNVQLSLTYLFSDLLEMKVSFSLLQDLCEEGLHLFPSTEHQTIIQASLACAQYIAKDKDAAFLEKLSPDMAIAVEALVREARLL